MTCRRYARKQKKTEFCTYSKDEYIHFSLKQWFNPITYTHLTFPAFSKSTLNNENDEMPKVASELPVINKF